MCTRLRIYDGGALVSPELLHFFRDHSQDEGEVLALKNCQADFCYPFNAEKAQAAGYIPVKRFKVSSPKKGFDDFARNTIYGNPRSPRVRELLSRKQAGDPALQDERNPE